MMTPLEMTPVLKPARWGGTRLESRLGKLAGGATDCAESWEVVDHGDDQSIVAGGDWAGWSLSRLVAEQAGPLLGVHAGLDQFPLLIKYLDANDRLSVQVHPDDEQAARYHPGERGKTEAWVILDAPPGSRVWVGLREGIDRGELERAVERGQVEQLLHAIDVIPGHCILVPAGTLHAIGEGILLAEVQQTSDRTFRLFDWDRTDPDGRPRPLHINAALDCTDFDRGPVDPVTAHRVAGQPGLEQLVDCPFFSIRRLSVTRPIERPGSDRFRVLMTLEGNGELTAGTGRHRLAPGRTLLLPASCPDAVIEPEGRLVLLEVSLPDA